MFFANDQRDNVREENPGISFGESKSDFHLSHRLTLSSGQVGKVLGDRWKALSEKQREPYEKKAATDKKRYEDEKAKYNVSCRIPTEHFQLTDFRPGMMMTTKTKSNAAPR